MLKLTFIIPCYNSEQTIGTVVSEIVSTVYARNEYTYEIILVNDGSSDCVLQRMRELAYSDTNIKGIDLSRNFGQHAALMTGFNYATGDIVVCLDDDGQTPASEMFNLIDKISEGYDLVFAQYDHKAHGVLRNAGSKLNDLMAQYLLNKPKMLSLMSYFACRRYVVDEVKKYTNPYPYMAGLLLRTTTNVTNVTVQHNKRKVGKSGYTFLKLISLWVNGFTAFSVKPLRVATVTGMMFALLGFIYGVYIIVRRLLDPSIPLGYSSLMASVIFIGGMVMLMLGMIGEYIGRIYISINNSPQYVIRETINIGDDHHK